MTDREQLAEYYRLLELEPGATLEDVKRAWRDLSRVWHPDRFQGDPPLRARTEAKFKAMNHAHQRLVEMISAQPRTPPPVRELTMPLPSRYHAAQLRGLGGPEPLSYQTREESTFYTKVACSICSFTAWESYSPAFTAYVLTSDVLAQMCMVRVWCLGCRNLSFAEDLASARSRDEAQARLDARLARIEAERSRLQAVRKKIQPPWWLPLSDLRSDHDKRTAIADEALFCLNCLVPIALLAAHGAYDLAVARCEAVERRQSPPRCLACGGLDFVEFTVPFVHPRCGGVITRTDEHAHGRVTSPYPYQVLLYTPEGEPLGKVFWGRNLQEAEYVRGLLDPHQALSGR